VGRGERPCDIRQPPQARRVRHGRIPDEGAQRAPDHEQEIMAKFGL
jgi:hypothetical protein